MTIEEIFAWESQNTEFSVQYPEKSVRNTSTPASVPAYLKTAVAFANGKGGRIVFGIDGKTREVAGIPEDKVFQVMDAVANLIADSCEPVVIPDVYLQEVNDKPVIIAEIRAGQQRPYYLKACGLEKGVYIRVGGTTRLADRDTAREMYFECDGRSYDEEIRRDIEVFDEDIEKLCRQLKEVAIVNSRASIQQTEVKDVTRDMLLSWNILKKGDDGRIYPTNAYVLLTGLDTAGESRSKIECASIRGMSHTVLLARRDFEGPLWKQVDEATWFVLRNIRMGCRLVGIYRQDIYELPPDSIRDLIVNAVMNCSYIQPCHIKVAVYDDFVEVTSPGRLLPGVSTNLMKEGFSKIRNRSLANAFAYMNLIEAWGSGIPEITQAMQEYGLREPELVEGEAAFSVRLYRALNELNTGRYDPKNDLNNGNGELKIALEIRLSELIRKNSKLTQKELGEQLSVSVPTVKRILSKMQADGKVIRTGSSRRGKWILINKK